MWNEKKGSLLFFLWIISSILSSLSIFVTGPLDPKIF